MWPAASHSVRSTRPEPGRPWTTSPSPWTAGTACGCTLTAHRLGRVAHRLPTWGGTPPQTPPRFAALRGLFEISPEARKPSGPAALRAALAPPYWSAGSRGPVRVSAPGGAAQGGRGGAAPHAWERPRRGGDRLGASIRPPLGGYLCRSQGRSPRTRDLQVSSVLVSMLA